MIQKSKIKLLALAAFGTLAFSGCTATYHPSVTVYDRAAVPHGTVYVSYSYPYYYDRPYYYLNGVYYYGGYYRSGVYYYEGRRLNGGHFYRDRYRYHNGRRYRAVNGRYGYYVDRTHYRKATRRPSTREGVRELRRNPSTSSTRQTARELRRNQATAATTSQKRKADREMERFRDRNATR